MFSRIPVWVFTTVLVVLAAVNLILARYLTADGCLPYRLLFSAWGVLTLGRIVLEPFSVAHAAHEPTTRVRIGEVTYWFATAAAVVLGLIMVDQTVFTMGVSPPNIIALCIPALVFAAGRGARYILAGY